MKRKYKVRYGYYIKKVNNKVHTILTFNVSDKTIYLELTPQSNKPYYGKEIIYNNEDELKKRISKSRI